MTDPHTENRANHRFLIGLVTGAVLGVAAALVAGPRIASELKRATGAARTLGNKTAARYQKASTRVGDAVDEVTEEGRRLRHDLTRQGRGLRDDVLEAVTRS